MVSDNDFYSHVPSDIKSNKLTSDPWGTSLMDDDIDWENYFYSAPWEGELRTSHTLQTLSKTVKRGGKSANFIFDKSVFVDLVHFNPEPAHSKTVFSEPAPLPTCVPAPRAPRAQRTPTPVSVPRVRPACSGFQAG